MSHACQGAMYASEPCMPVSHACQSSLPPLLQEDGVKSDGSSSGAMAWALALGAGAEAVQKYGGAAPGCRTMLDALLPAAAACLLAAKQGGCGCDGGRLCELLWLQLVPYRS